LCCYAVQNETVYRNVQDSSEGWRLVQDEERRCFVYQGQRTHTPARQYDVTLGVYKVNAK